MVADPGTTFEYGINTDWLGKVVEAVSGQSLDDYLAEHILAPLGMNSTAFLVNNEKRARYVPLHVKDQSGDWVTTDFEWDQHPDWLWFPVRINTADPDSAAISWPVPD